ncbi:hypothetical protein [Actinoplanes sp. NPDC026619]|uniref:hypothetical protein n=1 Tax=Actinoplanes sp. NPDC026619 TaxID=3155798 RepID=UPI003404A944
MARPWWIRCAAPVAVAVLLTGCREEVAGNEAIPPAKGESLGEMRRQANEILARYAAGVQPPSWDAANPPAGLSIDAAEGTETATTLTVAFTGSRDPATEPCGADYYAEAVESDRAVVVVVIAQPHAAGEICPMVGFPRTAAAKLANPLGKRTILEARQGQPIPLTPHRL